MKINIGNHEFTELWDGVLYKALSDYPNVSEIGRMSKNWLIKGVMRLRSIYWQMVAIWIA